MSRKRFVTQLKTFKISEQLQTMVDELVDAGSFATEAEIFRQGIYQMYIHNFPHKNDKK